MLRQTEGAMHRVDGIGGCGWRFVGFLPASINGDTPKPQGGTDFNVGK